jgi:hypothetical protein
VNGFIDHLYTRLGTSSNYSAKANLHNSQITTAAAKHFPACYVFTRRSLITASNSGDSSASASKSSLNAGSISTDSVTTDRIPGWRPFYTNLLVFSSKAEFKLTTVTASFLQTPVQNWLGCLNCLHSNSSARTEEKAPFPTACVSVAEGMCLIRRMYVYLMCFFILFKLFNKEIKVALMVRVLVY